MPSPTPASRTARRAAFVALAAAVLIGGCAVRETAPPPSDDELAARVAAREARLAAFDSFRVRGGLGVRDDETSLVARIDWHQSGDALELDLRGPFGFGAARLEARPALATFRRGDAAPIVGGSAERVLQRALGLSVPVPLGQLGLWLRGLPGEASEVRRDERGRLESLRWRDGSGTLWRARVRGYETLGELELPSLLTARGGGYHLRLALRDWAAADDDDPADEAGGEGEEGVRERIPVPAPGASRASPNAAGTPPAMPARLPVPTR